MTRRRTPGRLRRWMSAIAGISADAWLVPATIAAALLTVILANCAGARQARDANVLKLQERWSAPEMQARHSRIIDAFLCQYTPARAASVPSATAYEFMVQSTPEYVGLQADLGPYAEFFEEVHACSKEGLCNRQHACNLFASDARGIGIIFRRTITRQRLLMGAPDWAREIEDFTRYCSSVPPPERPALSPADPPLTLEAVHQEYLEGGASRQESDEACRRMAPPQDGRGVARPPQAAEQPEN